MNAEDLARLRAHVETTPMGKAGGNFCTHRLRVSSGTRAQFRPSFLRLFFGVPFLGFGVLFPVLFFASAKKPQPGAEVFVPAFGLIFVAIGVSALIGSFSPIVFDKEVGRFWRGSPMSGDSAALESVRAVQVLPKHVRGTKSVYAAWEINLVLEDASRVLVLSHGARDPLVEDAQQLARFLGVPVWELG